MAGRHSLAQINAELARAFGVKGSGVPNKYRAVRETVDGYKFDSKKEARRYGELKLLERAKQIEGLTVHPAYELRTTSGRVVGKAEFDFEYFDVTSPKVRHRIIEDVKSEPTNTALSKWKRKHFELQENIVVRLV